MAEAWNRLLWGVRFTGSGSHSFLVGTKWHKEANERNRGFEGEASRALLFRTRAYARKYCAAQRADYRRIGGVCAKWRFEPVKVRETVRPALQHSGDK